MTQCKHYRVEYIGPLVHKEDYKYMEKRLHKYDLYNCHDCRTTVAINRYELSKLEKEIIKTEVKK